MYRGILLLLLITFYVGNIKAQQRMGAAGSNTSTSTSNPGIVRFYPATNQEHEAPRAMEFNKPSVTATSFLSNINRYFNIPAEFSFLEAESNSDSYGMRHYLMQQYYKGIPLEGLGYRVHEKNGFVTSANGKAIHKINLDVNIILSEEQAFDLAVKHLETKDTVFSSRRKLIVSKGFSFTPESFSVAFQFDIDVSLIERWRISIDARSGEVINKTSLVKSCSEPPPLLPYGTGSGSTNYYGTKTIKVEKFDNGSSRLRGRTDNGGKIETYDFNNASLLALILLYNYVTVYDFYSSNNTYFSPHQKTAVSVQWAAEQTYEYYFAKHNRNSYDNNGATIRSYVRVDNNLDNAFWTGKVLAFGDGSNNNPLVELDVVSHELTHAVTDYEANLIYTYESGALNESFSDILGKAVEFSTFGDLATWQMAKHYRPGGLRDMSNPNLQGQPDTYLGDLWHSGYEDNGGVHTNSGVQNFWFYLLCEGGTGVNDNGESYTVRSIDMDTVVNIVYRNLTEYLISTSDYLDSRIGSLLATADLYGKNSSVYQEVEKAWDAVGVIDEPIITGFSLYDITATTVKFNGSLLPRGDTVTYHVEYGTTPELGSSTPIFTYTDNIEGIITGLQSETRYYCKLVATNENGSTYVPTEFTTTSLAPMVKIKNTIDITDTSAILYGQVNPNSLFTSYYFEYGPTPDLGLVSSSFQLTDTTEFLEVSAPVIGLQPRQTYYYKLVASNNFSSSSTGTLKLFTAVKPLISSFNPVAATVGTEVTIFGKNFNLTPDSNLIYFGAVRGTVLIANSTEIKVKVPAGASFGAITLLDAESGLATESALEFVPTFTGEFGRGDLQLRAAFDDIAIWKMKVQDMDGDGRPDIVTSHYNGITIFQNANTGGDITNESFIKANIPINNFNFLDLIDFDGNGLKDIVGNYGYGLRIYPNLSVPGYSYFGVPIDLPVSVGDIQFSDFDNDGHVDFASIQSLSRDSSIFNVFRNISPIITSDGFHLQYSKIVPLGRIQHLTLAYLNNDSKSDVLISNHDGDYFSILKNKSNPGVFDFEVIMFQDSLRLGKKSVAQDLNQDGWKDIISSMAEGKLNIFENNGQENTFLKPVTASFGHIENSRQPGDIDGDGKVDLLVGDQDGRFIVLKNKTEAGEHLSDTSFILFEYYGTNDNDREVRSNILINDLNGDGRPEVINNLDYYFYPNKGHQLEIWQNAPGDCPDPALIDLAIEKYSATILLPPNTTLDDFEIEYKASNHINWSRVFSTTLNNLQAGGSYNLRARAKCYIGFTSSYQLDFTTECVDLASFTLDHIDINFVTLSAINLSSFEIQYSEAGKGKWEAVSTNSDRISNLLPGTTYDLQYRGRCYSPTKFNNMQFTTLCPALSTLKIDDLSYDKAVVTWTSSFPGEAIVEYSNDNINWTTIDESRTMHPLIPGTDYFVRGRKVCTDDNSDFIYTSFTTHCPKVSHFRLNTVTPFNANITFDDESATGSYTVVYSPTYGEIISMKTNTTSIDLNGLVPGTLYTVSVAPECLREEDFTEFTFKSVCYVPFGLSADAITYTSAELSWDDNFSGQPYSIDYSIEGSGDWFTIESVLTKISLEALRPGTKYEARVHITCLDVPAEYASVQFETALYGETLLAPNPTENIVTIYPSKNLIGNSYGIYDKMGRMVAGGRLLNYTFDLSGFPSGLYILKIEEEKLIRIVRR